MGCNLREEVSKMFTEMKDIGVGKNLSAKEVLSMSKDMASDMNIKKDEAFNAVYHEYIKVNPESELSKNIIDNSAIPLSTDITSKIEKKKIKEAFGISNLNQLKSLKIAFKQLELTGDWSSLSKAQKKVYAGYIAHVSANPNDIMKWRIENNVQPINSIENDISTPFDPDFESSVKQTNNIENKIVYEEILHEEENVIYEEDKLDGLHSLDEYISSFENEENMYDSGDISTESTISYNNSTKKGSSAESNLYEPMKGDGTLTTHTVSLSKNLMTLTNNLLSMDADTSDNYSNLNPIALENDFIGHATKTMQMVQDFFAKHNNDIDLELTLFETSSDVHAVAHNVYRPTSGIATMGFDSSSNKLLNAQIEMRINKKQMQSSATETFLHEIMHVYFGKAIENSTVAKKELKRVREILLKRGATHEIFLEGPKKLAEAKGQNYIPTKAEISVAKEKFDYVFGKGVDIEEFAAYLISNPSVYNFAKSVEESNLNTIDIESNEKIEVGLSKTGIIDTVMDIVRAMLNAFNLSSDNITNSSSVDELLSNLMEHTAAANINKQNSSVKKRLIGFSEKIVSKTGVNVKYKAIEGAINRIGIKIDPYTRKAVMELEKLHNEVIKPTGKKVSESEFVVYAMEKLSKYTHRSIKNLTSGIVRQMFDDTAKGVHKDYYKMSRQIKSLINVESMKTRDAILSRRKDSKLFNINNSEKSTAFMNHTVRNDFFKYFSKNEIFDTSDKAINKRLHLIENALVSHMGGSDKFGLISELNSLSEYVKTERGESSKQQINVENIINGFHLSKEQKKIQMKEYAKSEGEFYAMVELAHEYVSLKSFVSLDGNSKKSAKDFLSDKEMVDEARIVYNQYVDKRDNIARTSHYRSFKDTPHGHIEYDKTSSDMTINLVEKEDFESSPMLNSTIGREVIAKDIIEINGKTYYKVKQKNLSSGMEEGFISFSSMSGSGISLRNTLINQITSDDMNISQKKEIVDNMLENINNDPLANGIIIPSKYGMIPKYDSYGNINDYMFPITVSDQENHLNYDTDPLASIAYSTSKIFRIKESINKNKNAISKITSDYMKNKNNDKMKYKIISPHSYSPSSQEIWNSIPAEVRNSIIEENIKKENTLDIKKNNNNKRKKYEFIAIPEEMVGLVFGVKQSTIANSEIINGISGSKSTRAAIRLIEKEVSLLLGKIKQKNTIFNTKIVSGNFISNMGTASVYGISHIDYAIKFKKEWNEMDEYLEIFSEIEKRKIIRDGSSSRLEKSRHDKHIQNLSKSLNKFKSLNMLFNDGQFTPLVNDMHLTEGNDIMTRNVYKIFKQDKESESFKKQAIKSAKKRYSENDSDKRKGMRRLIDEEEELLSKKGFLPVFLKKAFQNIIGEEGTIAHKFAVDLTIYSDTITRKIILDKLINDYKSNNKVKEVPEKVTNEYLSMLDQLLVNYSYATSGEQQYLEKVSGVFYLKYLFASAKGYAQAIKHNPTSVVTQQALQLGITDVADPLDTYAHNPIDSIANRFSLDDPLGMANSLFNPIDITM